MNLKRGFKSRANAVAISVRKKLGLTPFCVFDPESACVHFDISVIPLSSLGIDVSLLQGIHQESFSAMAVPYGISLAIVHNDDHSPNRQRSNIAHELSHLFLGHQPCTLLTNNKQRQFDSTIEAEASYLSGALLLPNEAAIRIVRKGLSSLAPDHYGISRSMLEYRLRVSGARVILERSLARQHRSSVSV